MKIVCLFVLCLIGCASAKPTPDLPMCVEPPEVVKARALAVEFTPAVDQSIPTVVFCVLDPSVPAMLCMTPTEAAERAKKSTAPDLSP